MSKDTPFNGALTGIAIAAASHWSRYDDDTQRRLRNVRQDAEEALDMARDAQSRADVLRSRLPTVMDAQVGLAIASPQPAAPTVVPSTLPLSRPDLANEMETTVSQMTWPPEPGQYDERGMVKRAGELTTMFLALTYEEVRTFVQGMVQSGAPSSEDRRQIYYAAHSLMSTICATRMSHTQYVQAWSRLFGGPTPFHHGNPDPHTDVNRPPQIVGPFGTHIQSVVPLSSLTGAGLYHNPMTDVAIRLRIVVGASGNVEPMTHLASVRFGTEYKTRAADGSLVPFQPVVTVNCRQAHLCADPITSTGFTLMNHGEIRANTVVDAFISVVPGVATEA